MAEQRNTPLVTLPPEAIARLEAMEAQEEDVQAKIRLMKDLGVDTAMLEEKLTWAIETRKTILRAHRGE